MGNGVAVGVGVVATAVGQAVLSSVGMLAMVSAVSLPPQAERTKTNKVVMVAKDKYLYIIFSLERVPTGAKRLNHKGRKEGTEDAEKTLWPLCLLGVLCGKANVVGISHLSLQSFLTLYVLTGCCFRFGYFFAT